MRQRDFIIGGIMAATAALALGLLLQGTTAHPYQTAREATSGPDALATDFPSGTGAPASPAALGQIAPLARAQDVDGHSGPLPVAFPVLTFNGHADAVMAEGRGNAPAAVDQPELTEGSWVHPGAVVIERSFADALGVHADDRITLNGRPFRVAGVAVTAAFPVNGVGFLEGSSQWPNPGLIWTTTPDAASLATRQYPLGYVLNLKLTDPADAENFADRFDPGGYTNNTGGLYVIPWQMISHQDGLLMVHEQKILLVGSWLLALLAVGSLAIVVGGRMAAQNRRVGLLKAVGGTPALVAGVLLAEYLALAVIAGAAGLVAGRLTAPLLTSPGAGLLGAAGAPQLTLPVIALVIGVALAVATLASYVPALRAARTSTVDALADAARPPRRHARLTAYSTGLPGLSPACRAPGRPPAATCPVGQPEHRGHSQRDRCGALRPRHLDYFPIRGGCGDRQSRPGRRRLHLPDRTREPGSPHHHRHAHCPRRGERHLHHLGDGPRFTAATALTRALGATAGQLTAGLSAAQLLPAIAGALAGIAGGYGLFTAANQGANASQPPAWWLITAVLGTLISVAGLTAVPARLAAHLPVAETLQAGGP